jgi:hypothetical protein
VFRHATRTIVLQFGLVSALLALSTAAAFGQPTRDHTYAIRSHPYSITPTAQAPRTLMTAHEAFAWDAFALGVSIPLGAMLLGGAALTVRAGRVPRPRPSR